MKHTEVIRRAAGYIRYQLLARHKRGHGIHSPAVYDFISRVVGDRNSYPEYRMIREALNNLYRNNSMVDVGMLTAPSQVFSDTTRRVARMARVAGIPDRYGRLLFRIARYCQAARMVEFGTCLGQSALYLSYGYREGTVVTVESSGNLTRFAGQFLKDSGCCNVDVITSTFSEFMSGREEEEDAPGLVFLDGDHRYAATLEYYRFFRSRMDQGVIVLDDINYSGEMRKAWNEIVSQERSGAVTLDLFRLGIVLVRPCITPGHFVVRY